MEGRKRSRSTTDDGSYEGRHRSFDGSRTTVHDRASEWSTRATIFVTNIPPEANGEHQLKESLEKMLQNLPHRKRHPERFSKSSIANCCVRQFGKIAFVSLYSEQGTRDMLKLDGCLLKGRRLVVKLNRGIILSSHVDDETLNSSVEDSFNAASGRASSEPADYRDWESKESVFVTNLSENMVNDHNLIQFLETKNRNINHVSTEYNNCIIGCRFSKSRKSAFLRVRSPQESLNLAKLNGIYFKQGKLSIEIEKRIKIPETLSHQRPPNNILPKDRWQPRDDNTRHGSGSSIVTHQEDKRIELCHDSHESGKRVSVRNYRDPDTDAIIVKLRQQLRRSEETRAQEKAKAEQELAAVKKEMLKLQFKLEEANENHQMELAFLSASNGAAPMHGNESGADLPLRSEISRQKDSILSLTKQTQEMRAELDAARSSLDCLRSEHAAQSNELDCAETRIRLLKQPQQHQQQQTKQQTQQQ